MLDAAPRPLSDHQRAVLGAVLGEPGIGRSRLSELLGVSAQTTMRAVNPLVEDAILEETAQPSGGRGKPATSLRFRPGALLTVGISLALDRVRVRICDLAGEIVAGAETARIYTDATHQLADLDAKIDEALGGVAAPSRIVGVGVSVQGYFLEMGARFAARADPAGWAAIDLRKHLTGRFGVPVRLMNDGKTLATSIMRETGSSDFLCLHLGSGIGGGIVLNGALVEGIHGNAGEIGQLFSRTPLRPTEPAFLAAANLADWSGWSGLEGLPPQTRVDFEAFLDQAAAQITEAIGTTLALLDFAEVYLCSRMPRDLLVLIAERLAVEPLGANLDGAESFLNNAPPPVIPRHTPNHALLACRMALESFLTQADTKVA